MNGPGGARYDKGGKLLTGRTKGTTKPLARKMWSGRLRILIHARLEKCKNQTATVEAALLEYWGRHGVK